MPESDERTGSDAVRHHASPWEMIDDTRAEVGARSMAMAVSCWGASGEAAPVERSAPGGRGWPGRRVGSMGDRSGVVEIEIDVDIRVLVGVLVLGDVYVDVLFLVDVGVVQLPERLPKL